MSFLDEILKNFDRFGNRNAFCIKEKFYSYSELGLKVRNIITLIKSKIHGRQNTIGIITNDDLETYASIFATWFTGNVFVPLNQRNPETRNTEIIKLAGIKNILTSETLIDLSCKTHDIKMFDTDKLGNNNDYSGLFEEYDTDILYLLFTSGSTGIPKGVPVSLKNLDSFIHSFISYGYGFIPDDRFLQIYNLSFDASVHCYVVPLVTGSCVYTVPQDEIKYLYALKLMKDHDLTFVKMPPSTIAYLRPYFNKIRLVKLKYCLLGGEPLDHDLVKEWARCIPNARIQNVYGPTEATINCLIYNLDIKRTDKHYNGIVAIGKPFGDNKTMVLDQNCHQVEPGQIGELCVAGSQITPGYWKNPEKNRESFIELKYDNNMERFYRTGDLTMVDEEGDYLFCGRIDEQVQIDGFRVEMGEIEKHARDFLKVSNIAAVSFLGPQKTMQIHLFIENARERIHDLKKYLESRLPVYMLPEKIHNIKEFPKSSGGKINKAELRKTLG